jgi:hypothetical protein
MPSKHNKGLKEKKNKNEQNDQARWHEKASLK